METNQSEKKPEVFKTVLKTIAIVMVGILILGMIAFFIVIAFFD